MGLLGKRKKKSNTLPKAEYIVFEKISSDDDKYITELASNIMTGNVLIFNVEEYDIDGVNKAIAFLYGVIYAIDGVVYRVADKIFLFGPKDTFDDGSVHALLKTFE